jgi:hypothetical protein
VHSYPGSGAESRSVRSLWRKHAAREIDGHGKRRGSPYGARAAIENAPPYDLQVTVADLVHFARLSWQAGTYQIAAVGTKTIWHGWASVLLATGATLGSSIEPSTRSTVTSSTRSPSPTK